MFSFRSFAIAASLLVGAASWANPAFATTDPLNSDTIIDCRYGDDSKAAPFDATTPPYFSLKKGIEDSIRYLNEHGYQDPNNEWAQSNAYVIKVRGNCNYTQQDGGVIYLDFDGTPAGNELQIKGDQGYFGVANQSFYLARQNAGNISFYNANFIRNDVSRYYFDGFNPAWASCAGNGYSSNGSGIKIYDSIINISAWQQFSHYTNWDNYWCWSGYRPPNYFHPGGYLIENASINYYVNNNTEFRLPVVIKDAKIKVKNANSDGAKFDVWFYAAWEDRDGYKYGSATVISSEIDMGGNNFKTDDNVTVFVNDKFANVGTFVPGTDPSTQKKNVFVNNSVQCSNNVDITHNDVAYNNIFSNGFTDANDSDNFKRNFSGTSTNEKGVGWVYRKFTGGSINVSVDYKTLYEQLHPGQTLDEGANPVYLVIE